MILRARRRYYAAIACLDGRNEMIVAARFKSLKRPEKTANSNANNNNSPL
jgi:hypothetical protein